MIRYERGGGFRVMELLDRATFNFYLFRLVTHPRITEYNFYPPSIHRSKDCKRAREINIDIIPGNLIVWEKKNTLQFASHFPSTRKIQFDKKLRNERKYRIELRVKRA